MNTGTDSADRSSSDPRSRGPASDRGGKQETAAERRLVNMLIVGFILLILGAALWLGDALLETRRIDDCMASGRRNCAPITVPPPPSR